MLDHRYDGDPYDVPKTILTVIVNIVGMGMAIFLGMVF